VAYGNDERPHHPGLEDYRHFFGVKSEFDEATLRRVTAAYYGMISYLDDNIGKLLAALERNGLTDNTRILYTSDHGESLGQKGMFSKCNMFEESTGVPMILAGADVPKGQTIATPTQLLDVFPTILQATGTVPTEADRALPGTSLLELASGARPKRAILAEQHSAGAKSAVFMLRKNDVKYVHYMDYPAQLYDLGKDPLELTDVSADPAYLSVLIEYEEMLNKLLDPEKIDAMAKQDQAERLEAGGGVDKIVAQGSPGYTPAPGEQPVYM
jgi:choline-sulfatase